MDINFLSIIQDNYALNLTIGDEEDKFIMDGEVLNILQLKV